jgi:hypothetical protein
MLAEWRTCIALGRMDSLENIGRRRFVVALHASGGPALAIQRTRSITGRWRSCALRRVRSNRRLRDAENCGAQKNQNRKSTCAISYRHPLSLAPMAPEATISARISKTPNV